MLLQNTLMFSWLSDCWGWGRGGRTSRSRERTKNTWTSVCGLGIEKAMLFDGTQHTLEQNQKAREDHRSCAERLLQRTKQWNCTSQPQSPFTRDRGLLQRERGQTPAMYTINDRFAVTVTEPTVLPLITLLEINRSLCRQNSSPLPTRHPL